MTIGDLLAIIHGDGGHHQDEVGTEQAIKDAAQVVYALRARIDELETALKDIAYTTGDMPAAYNNEVDWYHRQFYSCKGIATRVLGEKP